MFKSNIKGNYPNLLKDIVDWFDFGEENNFKVFEFDAYKTMDKGHGHIETRKYYITEDYRMLAGKVIGKA